MKHRRVAFVNGKPRCRGMQVVVFASRQDKSVRLPRSVSVPAADHGCHSIGHTTQVYPVHGLVCIRRGVRRLEETVAVGLGTGRS
jgi:hypothetical protein